MFVIEEAQKVISSAVVDLRFYSKSCNSVSYYYSEELVEYYF